MKVTHHSNKKTKAYLIEADDYEFALLKDKFSEELSYISRFRKFKIRRTLKNYNILKALGAEFDELSELAVVKRKQDFVKRQAAVKKVKTIKAATSFDFGEFKFKTVPWEHQKKALALAIEAESLGLLMDMRTGKTFVLANVVQYLKDNNHKYKTLTVCTKQTMYDTWVSDVQKHTSLSVCVLDGGSKKIVKRLNNPDIVVQWDDKYIRMPGKPDLYVINHDGVRNKDVNAALKAMKFDVLEVDESHNFRNVCSKRTQALMKIRETIDRCIISTGTLITRSPEDVYSQMRLVNPFIFNMEFSEFKYRYGHYRKLPGKNVEFFVGPRKENMNELWHIVDSQSFKIAIEDCHDMPTIMFSKVSVILNPEERAYHDELFEDLITYITDKEGAEREIVTTALGKLAKIAQVTSGFMYDDGEQVPFKNPSKLAELSDVLEQILSRDRKVVVWANFKFSRKMIAGLLKQKKIKFGLIDSNTKSVAAERHKFDNDSKCKVMLCSTRCGAEGLDLSAAMYAIYYDNSFQYEHRRQSERRIYTHTAKAKHGDKVVVIDLVAQNSVDQLILALLGRKRNISEFINLKTLKEFYHGC